MSASRKLLAAVPDPLVNESVYIVFVVPHVFVSSLVSLRRSLLLGLGPSCPVFPPSFH